MHHDPIAKRWKELAVKIKQNWDRLTDEDLKHGNANARYLADRIRVRYDIGEEAADRQIREFQRQL